MVSCSTGSRPSVPQQLANIHDTFFKQLLGDPGTAGTFLREHLPADVAALLGPELPEPLPGSFVGEQLAQHHSDLLFRVRLKTGEDAFAYVLLEHKSSPDLGAPLQLLRYIVRILVECYDENNKRLPLAPVIPLLAHHGPEGWTVSREFVDLFGAVPESLRPYLVSFRHALVDFASIDDAALSAHLRLRAFLKALKYALRRDLPERIDVLLAEAPALEVEDLVRLLTYIGQGPVPVSDDVVKNALGRLVPSREKTIMASFGQQYLQQGLQQGQAKSLARLLERRFGVVPPHFRESIFSADLASVEMWFERAIDAPDLQSVFDSN
jgi:predicted transposase/invertase (TIGR01784 family)